MRISRQLKASAGITQASVMMGTPQNKEVLREAGLFDGAVEAAGPSDMVVVVEAETEEAASAALAQAEAALSAKVEAKGNGDTQVPSYRTTAAGAEALGGAGLAMISVPGPYAAAEALKALKKGLHVFLFSDNVSLDDEIELKRFAQERGLLVMGPDCGTALVGGVPLGFVNAVRRGGIGLVGASGTGMQEVMCLIDRWGSGISHAFGTGSRDLSKGVGGITMASAMEFLAEDADTKVIVLLSKPPARAVAEGILSRAASLSKPVVVCFLGNPADAQTRNVYRAGTLEAAAQLAVALERGEEPAGAGKPQEEFGATKGKPGRLLRGLFSGGTLAEEALLIISSGGIRVLSNLSGDESLEDVAGSRENIIIDMGSDEFTVGRPHPMIDYSYRLERLQREAGDPAVAVILMDVVLGFGSHPDPAAELAPAVAEAIKQARRANRELEVVINVVGTEADPQRYSTQVGRLKAAGALIASSNAHAARIARGLLTPVPRQAAIGGER